MFSILHPNSVSLLAWTIYLSFAGALVLALMPARRPVLSRWLALAFAVGGLALAVQGFVVGMGQGRVMLVDLAWVPSMGIRFLLAADGISRVLVLLTGLAAVAGVLFSWNIELRTNEFFAASICSCCLCSTKSPSCPSTS